MGGLKERSASKESSVRSLASRSTCCPSSFVSEHELKQRLASQDDEIKLLRQERDFYFEKLRNAELLCESVETSSDPQVAAVIQELQQILYKDNEVPEVVTTETVLPNPAV